LVDIVQHGLGGFLLETARHRLLAARLAGAAIPMKGTRGSLGATGVIHGVADVPELGAGRKRGDAQQPVRRGLGVRHVAGAYNGLELDAGERSGTRSSQLPSGASRSQKAN